MTANPNRAKQPPQKKATAKKSSVNKSVAKKPVGKKLPVQVMPPLGPFGKIFLQNLKKAPLGTPDEAVIMETLRSLPPDQLKAALKKATSKERNLLFSVIPGNQIKSVLGSLPTTVLAPANPPLPPPSPTDGPPASILMTTYENVVYPPAQNDPNWTEKITGGKTIRDWRPWRSTVFEWTSVYDPRFEKEGSLNNPMVGLTGWAVHPELSTSDVWFVHPFGFDYEFYIVPDPQYEGLLAASNSGKDPNYAAAIVRAKALKLDAPKGVLGVEMGQGLVPQSFRNLITDGTRIATFGRWIVDSGHPDFHTEIHPPLLMAVAKPAPAPAGVQGASKMTSVQIMSRPYTVSEHFAEGNFIDHLFREVAKVAATFLGIPLSKRVEAHPTVFTTPYEGRPYVKLLVQPPPREPPPTPMDPGRVSRPQRLMVSYHFTHRAGVAAQVFDAGNGTVGIIIVLGDLNPAPLPPPQEDIVQWGQLTGEWSWLVDALQVNTLFLDPLLGFILNRGILTDKYQAPSAWSPLDNQNVAAAVRVDQLKPGAGLSEDDEQPFPIYGWLNVWWEDEPPIVQ